MTIYDDSSADITQHTPKDLNTDSNTTEDSSSDTSTQALDSQPAEGNTPQQQPQHSNTSEQPVKVNVQIPSLKTGLKLKNHAAHLSSQTLFLYGGENQLTKEVPQQMLVLKLKSGYLKSVNVTHPNLVPFKGGNIFTEPAELVDEDEDLGLEGEGSTQGGQGSISTTTTSTTPASPRIITFGGVDEEETPVQGFNALSLDTFQWQTDIKMEGTWEVPSDRNGASCVTVGQCHYFFGGEDAKGKLLGGVWKYDTKARAFSYIHPRVEPSEEGAKIPPPSFHHASCAWRDEVLIFGGFVPGSKPSRQIYRFNTVSQRWGRPIALPQNIYPEGVCFHKMCAVGDYLVIVGGTKFAPIQDVEEGSEPDALGETVYFCNLRTHQWHTQIEMQGKMGARVGHTLHTHKDQVWVVGGDVDNIADQDIVVLQTDLLSQQSSVKSAQLELETVSLTSLEKREAFPPPKSPFDSVIISYKDGVTLNKWYGDRKQQWRLLYRATKDGFGSSQWHAKVDNQGPTLSIVLANGYIFGGYTPIAWKSSGADQYDDQSWIFSLKNPNDDNQYKFPKIPMSVKKQRSVYHASGYGLWMGSNDLLIYNSADANTSSNANLGKAFEYNLTYDTATFFCGQSGFKVTDLETFALV